MSNIIKVKFPLDEHIRGCAFRTVRYLTTTSDLRRQKNDYLKKYSV